MLTSYLQLYDAVWYTHCLVVELFDQLTNGDVPVGQFGLVGWSGTLNLLEATSAAHRDFSNDFFFGASTTAWNQNENRTYGAIEAEHAEVVAAFGQVALSDEG